MSPLFVRFCVTLVRFRGFVAISSCVGRTRKLLRHRNFADAFALSHESHACVSDGNAGQKKSGGRGCRGPFSSTVSRHLFTRASLQCVPKHARDVYRRQKFLWMSRDRFRSIRYGLGASATTRPKPVDSPIWTRFRKVLRATQSEPHCGDCVGCASLLRLNSV